MSCKVNNFIFTSQNTEVGKVKWPPWSHICRKDTPRDGATKPVTTAERDAISFSPLPHPTLLGSMWRRSHEGIGTRADTGVASVFMVHSLAEWTPAGAQPHRKVEPSAGLCRTHLPHHSPITHTCYINFNRKLYELWGGTWIVGLTDRFSAQFHQMTGGGISGQFLDHSLPQCPHLPNGWNHRASLIGLGG